MVMRRAPVGAHYGLTDWLLQRLTAVVMALYALLFVAIALANGGIDHDVWRAMFANGAFRLASFLFMAALLYHAWVGAREIYMDYVKPTGLRVAVYALTVAALLGYLGWTIQILWGHS
jgi:succinate dehydrogenase / fumarate reductase membrane anchor subunit